MKLGFVSAILPELRFDEVLKLAGEIGYDCVEVMCWPQGKAERRYAGVTHLDVDDLDKKKIEEIVSSSGVDISALGYYPNPLTNNLDEAKVAVDHVKKVIAAAAKLGVGMNTFVGRDWKLSIEDNWSRLIETWTPLLALADELGVRVGIENCPMLFTSDEWPGGKNLAISPSIWRRLYEDLPSDNFGLNFDPSHFVWQQMDYLSAMREFSHKLFHVHAKDVRMDLDRLHQVGILGHPNEYHTPKLPGMGDVDWGKFFSVLTDTGYDGPVCVEVEDRAFEGSFERRTDSLRQSHNYLRQFIPKS